MYMVLYIIILSVDSNILYSREPNVLCISVWPIRYLIVFQGFPFTSRYLRQRVCVCTRVCEVYRAALGVCVCAVWRLVCCLVCVHCTLFALPPLNELS